MSLSVTGIGSDGRITPKGTNVRVPNASAGIGDLVYKSGDSFRVYARGTCNSSTIDGYTLYCAIYSFFNGLAMVVGPNNSEVASLKWSTSGAPPSWLNKYFGSGTVLMRNGQKAQYYAQMNTAQNSGYITGGGSAPVTLASAYQATSLASSTFAANASAEIKRRYGSWQEYIRQTLRVNGAPGSPFGATFDGCKVHEYGRYVTQRIGSDSTYPAVKQCYDYRGALGTDPVGTWWLPSMFDLGELMIDEHLDKVNENSAVLSVSKGLGRWSSVLVSGSYAWRYFSGGMSDYLGLTDAYSFQMVRPVTLLKLV